MVSTTSDPHDSPSLPVSRPSVEAPPTPVSKSNPRPPPRKTLSLSCTVGVFTFCTVVQVFYPISRSDAAKPPSPKSTLLNLAYRGGFRRVLLKKGAAAVSMLLSLPAAPATLLREHLPPHPTPSCARRLTALLPPLGFTFSALCVLPSLKQARLTCNILIKNESGAYFLHSVW